MSPPPTPASDDALPPGTRLGELEILRVIGVGGFGIVYLARDHSLERDVALKEYMPASLASRGTSGLITVRSASYAETYAIGLRSFVNEARLLARFDHPSLVKVYRFWEDKGTAYMVMPHLEGRNLRELRKAMDAPPNGRWIRGLLDPVLDAVDRLHREGVFHRDIAPDNIVVTTSGLPVLLDFGAARRAISDRTQTFTAILKPSYAPIEQYADATSMRQGPWTDLYAIGAVLHFLLFGVPPSPATARAVYDDLAGLAQREVPGVSARFMSALAWALAVKPQDRPQDVAAFRAALDGRIAAPAGVAPEVTLPGATALMPISPAYDKTLRLEPATPTAYEKTLRMESATRSAAPPATPPATPPAPPPAVAAPPAARDVPPRVAPPAGARPMPKVERKPAPAPPARSAGLIWAIVAAVAVGVAVAAWFAMRSAPSSSAAVSSTAPAQASRAASVPIGAPAPAPAVPAATPPAPAVSPTAPSTAVDRAPAPRATEPRPRPAPAIADGALRPRPAEPAAESAREVTPAPMPAVATTPPAAAPAPAAAVPARQSVDQTCDRRLLIAWLRCIERECRKPANRSDPDCISHLEERRRRTEQ